MPLLLLLLLLPCSMKIYDEWEYRTYPFISAPPILARLFSSLRSPLRFRSIFKKWKKGKTKCSFQPALFQYAKVDLLTLIQIQWTFPTGASIKKTQKCKIKTAEPVTCTACMKNWPSLEEGWRGWGDEAGEQKKKKTSFLLENFVVRFSDVQRRGHLNLWFNNLLCCVLYWESKNFSRRKNRIMCAYLLIMGFIQGLLYCRFPCIPGKYTVVVQACPSQSW